MVDTDVLVTSKNGDKNHAIYQNNNYTSLENKEWSKYPNETNTLKPEQLNHQMAFSI